MPNHVTTVLTVTGPDVDAFVAKHIVGEGKARRFDFATIVPVPACVDATGRDENIASRNFGDYQVELCARAMLAAKEDRLPADVYPMQIPADVRTWGELLAHYEANKPGLRACGEAALRCAAETGHAGWYEWNVANWGTKWNSYDYEERSREPEKFIFKFVTAWSVPLPIFKKLCELWPSLSFESATINEGGWAAPQGKFSAHGVTMAPVEATRELHLFVYGHTERFDEEEGEE